MGFLCAGIVFLGGIPFVNWLDTFAEPKAQAMLQTALFLVGGWFVMLWFRRKGYFSTESNLNSFIFVDEKYYWNWSHYSVDVINIENIKFFECVRNDANQTYDFHLESDHGLVKMAISKVMKSPPLNFIVSYLINMKKTRNLTKVTSRKENGNGFMF